VGEAATTISANRKVDPAGLSHTLRGELDWIVMKAMEKDRNRRYESASDFAKDLQRYLDDEPVEACPPSTAYRLGKFYRRNKTLFATVATIAAVLFVATVVSSTLAAWAVRAENAARVNLAQSRRSEAVAKKDRATALDAMALAKRQEKLAKQQRVAAEYNNYVSSIRLAQNELNRGETSNMFGTLTSLVPEPERPDFRGWEWYSLFSQFHGARFTCPFQRGAIAWSPDAKSLATVDRVPGLVNIWDVRNGQLTLSLKGLPDSINSMSWSPDGRYLATGGDRRKIVIWGIPSGKKIRSLHGHTTAIRCIDWSADGRLASGAEDGGIYIWDAQTGEKPVRLTATRQIHSLDWHPDGSLLLAVAGHVFSTKRGGWVFPKASIWDTRNGKKIAT
jgi:hypothetical protein